MKRLAYHIVSIHVLLTMEDVVREISVQKWIYQHVILVNVAHVLIQHVKVCTAIYMSLCVYKVEFVKLDFFHAEILILRL